MSLPSEVSRILGKDLRVLRWPLTAWSALLVLSVLRGLGELPALHDVLYAVTIFVPVMAATLVAYAVTLDPAGAGPTFWGIHRQRPFAVATAKGVFALLLVAVMLTGHAVVLRSHGLSALQVASLTAVAARTSGPWILAAAALAACARDAKGWVVGTTLVGVLAMLLSAWATDESGLMLMRWPVTAESASVLLTAISVVVLLWTYRHQLTGLRAGVRTAVLMVLAAIVLVAPRASSAGPFEPDGLPRDAALIVHRDRITSRIEKRGVLVEVPVTYPDSSVFSGLTTTWTLQLRDGSVVNLLPTRRRVRRGAQMLQPEENVALWGNGPVSRVLQFHYPLDSATLARVEGRLTSVTLAIETDRVVMRRVGNFSAARGGTIAVEGERYRVAPVSPEGRFETAVSWVYVPAPLSRVPWSASYMARPILTLVPEHGKAARVLRPAADDARDDDRRSGSWVLPGNATGAGVLSLVTAGDTALAHGNVVAFAGEYAGRVTQVITAPIAR